MSVYAYIFEESPALLWGLTARERLCRMLARIGVKNIVTALNDAPSDADLLLLRGDYLYDERVLRGLVQASATVLEVRTATGSVPVAAHVAAVDAPKVWSVLLGQATSDTLGDITIATPGTVSSAFQSQLRKADVPYVLPIRKQDQRLLERRLFAGSYKGITDLITKWLWPRPAEQVTRWCVRGGITPNHVTTASFVLVILAGWLFAEGQYGWGLVFAWIMTFLDTVDGKLARVTVTSTQFGHLFDHGIDLIHPPLWYIAWGVGLASFAPAMVFGWPLSSMLWTIVIFYVVGRLVEGLFQWFLGKFGIFCWRRFDSYFRLITARRNPNMIMLTLAALLGQPDWGLFAVAVWTVLSSLILLLRLGLAWRERLTRGQVQSWLAGIEQGHQDTSLAVRWFAGSTSPASR